LISIKDKVKDDEWQLRCDLAACYRMAAGYGWDDLIFTHFSVRIPGSDHHFLINPFGLFFEEITASSLLKVDLGGNLMMPSDYLFNPAGFVIHGAIHEGREDALCILHTHTIEGMAVASQKEGLLPLTQTALSVGSDISYHDYEGIVLDQEERARLLPNVGTSNNIIFRNHGLMTLGRTIGEAFMRLFFLQKACEAQVMAQAGGGDLIIPPENVIKRVDQQVNGNCEFMSKLTWDAVLRKAERDFPDYKN
jgi:ribulose-5-phosphate 4-epimerase/fuculose-1-phosphate aldolase